ncbi:MAG: deoxyhypusine synthase family protein [Candidatus Hodarchaeales archaeon]|jgi:deoxyhypusine synthase
MNKNDFSSFINQYSNITFNGGQFSKACEILKEIFTQPHNEPISLFLALSGAIVPAGLQSYIVKLLKTGMISGIITTGAILTHDYIEDLGFKHKELGEYQNDAELRKKGINRILDVGAPNEAFEVMEKHLHTWMEKQYGLGRELKLIPPPEFFRTLGNILSDKSILGQCTLQNIPIYCPAIMDSMLGVQAFFFSENGNNFIFDHIAELKQFLSQCFGSKKTAALILGGGVSKNYLFQGMMISNRELNYAIQVTMDRPEHGGLSGATLEEAISWGKINQDNAKLATVIADITLVLPLFTKYISELKK